MQKYGILQFGLDYSQEFHLQMLKHHISSVMRRAFKQASS